MEEFLRRRAGSVNAGRIATTLEGGRADAERHANRTTFAKKVGRLTAARKNGTNAETYCEPQTPCGTTVV
jgi:hypothetical protein